MCVQVNLSQIPLINLSLTNALIEAKQEHAAYCPWNPYYPSSAMIPLIAMHLLHQAKEHPHLSQYGDL
jgi:hypothetical protein